MGTECPTVTEYRKESKREKDSLWAASGAVSQALAHTLKFPGNSSLQAKLRTKALASAPTCVYPQRRKAEAEEENVCGFRMRGQA